MDAAERTLYSQIILPASPILACICKSARSGSERLGPNARSRYVFDEEAASPLVATLQRLAALAVRATTTTKARLCSRDITQEVVNTCEDLQELSLRRDVDAS